MSAYWNLMTIPKILRLRDENVASDAALVDGCIGVNWTQVIFGELEIWQFFVRLHILFLEPVIASELEIMSLDDWVSSASGDSQFY